MEQFNQAQLRRGVLPRSIDCRQIKLVAFKRWMAEREVGLLEARQVDVETFLDQRHISARTRYDWISHLHSFYAWAILEELAENDPTRRIIRPKLRRNLPRPAATADIIRALELATPKQRCWLLLAAYQGLRCQEIAGMRREDVVEGEGLLRVVHGKGNVERILPLKTEVLTALRHLPMPKTGWIFRRPLGGPYNPEQLSVDFRAFFEHAGITAKPHQLRHWFASHLYAQTKDLRLVQEMLGHASPTTTAIYVAFDRQQAGEAIEGLSLEDAS